MALILLQAMIQSITSTLYWIGLYVGIRALPGEKSRRLRWTVGSAAVLVVWLVRYFHGELSGVFAIPAGVGDVLTGLFAPLVAYWWVARTLYARTAAIVWNLFGMADLVNAVLLGALTGGGGGG